jgi:hypothetical protein
MSCFRCSLHGLFIALRIPGLALVFVNALNLFYGWTVTVTALGRNVFASVPVETDAFSNARLVVLIWLWIATVGGQACPSMQVEIRESHS